MTTRTSITIVGAGLMVLFTACSITPAQDPAANEAEMQAQVEYSDAESGIGDFDDPIWPVKHGIDPAADRILRDWSEYLAGAKTFTVTVEVAEDVLLAHGQMIQYGGVSKVVVQRPGSVRVQFRGEERQSNVVIHDGRCTLYNVASDIYATTEVPTLLDDAIDKIVEKYGLNVPVADILYQDPYAAVIGAVDYAYVVGRANIDGVDCHHLAFAQETIDWQVWIQAGPEPLLRKLVITYKDDTGWPQYTARFPQWDLNPRLSEHYFEFEPPASADKVDFLPSQSEETK